MQLEIERLETQARDLRDQLETLNCRIAGMTKAHAGELAAKDREIAKLRLGDMPEAAADLVQARARVAALTKLLESATAELREARFHETKLEQALANPAFGGLATECKNEQEG